MSLSRRKFLQLAGASALATLPALSLFSKADAREVVEDISNDGGYIVSKETSDNIIRALSRGREYGNIMPISAETAKSLPEFKKLLKSLLRDAKKTLPPGCRFEVRMKIPTDFGRSRGIAWYTNKEIATGRRRLFLTTPKEAVKDRNMAITHGYHLLGRGRA